MADSSIASLLNDIVNNNLLDGKTPEEMTEIYKKINPYNQVLNKNELYTCASVTNLRDRYLANLKMTSLVGFMYRMVKEYDDLYFVLSSDQTEESKKASQIKQAIVKDFLDKIFEYNPEDNVRSSYDPNEKDPERKAWPLTENGQMTKAEYDNSYAPVPSIDAFYRWQWYENANYDKILSTVNDLYSDKPDLEYAIQIHKTFDNIKDAESFAEVNSSLISASIIVLYPNKWNILGQYKTNRSRMNFYNQDNDVLKKITDRVEKDELLGKDMLKKRVIRRKKQNIKQSGPADSKLQTHIGYNKEQSILTKAEEKELVTDNAQDKYEDVDENGIPNDALLVDMYTNKDGQLVKSSFFTKAEVNKPTKDGKLIT